MHASILRPGDWSSFKATRLVRGVIYSFSVERVGVGNQISLTVDGQPVEGSVVPLPPQGVADVAVEVKVGAL